MGLYASGGGIDPLAIKQLMSEALYPWFTTEICIIDNATSLVRPLVIWQGMSRVQPYRRENDESQAGNYTTVQSVRFQVDFAKDGPLPDIKTGYEVFVVDKPGLVLPDPYMILYQHTVNASMNSSLAWIRTIECSTDTEARPNYDYQLDIEGNVVFN